MRITVFLLALLPTRWLDSYTGFDLSLPASSKTSSGIDSIVVRNATLEDADDIADVITSAFESSPTYRYIYQFRHEQREFHHECTKKRAIRIIKMASQTDNAVFHVIDQPIDLNADSKHSVPRRTRRAVAIAVWIFLPLPDSSSNYATPLWNPALPLPPNLDFVTLLDSKDQGTRFDCSQQLDANHTRAAYLNPKVERAENKYIFDAYDPQLYLAGLATHPHWDGHGFAAAHLRWGLHEAQVANINTTLIGTPAGYPVYKSVGFEDIKNLTFSAVPGDKEGPFWYEVMRAPPRS